MSAFGSSIGRFPSSNFTGFGGKFRPLPGHTQGLRKLTAAEAKQVRHKLRAAAYTHRGVDWEKLFLFYSSTKRVVPESGEDAHEGDEDNAAAESAEIGLIEFRRLLRNDAKIPVSQLSDVDVKSLFHSIDLDGSGEIDAEEFMAWVQGDEQADESEDASRRKSPARGSPPAREWGQSSGYGRTSPRKLASPSQRRYDLKKGWVMNNDENSEAEAARIRRSDSAAARLLRAREEENTGGKGGSGLAKSAKSMDETVGAGIQGSMQTSPSFVGTMRKTDAELLAQCRSDLESLRREHAASLAALADAKQEVERLRGVVQAKDAKIKDQRRTITVLNRR